MSIFGNIVSKLFGHSSAQAAPASSAAPPAKGGAPSTGTPTPAPSAGAAAPSEASPAAAANAIKDVDIAGILDGLVAKHGQKLDWKHSIVDLLKALDLDSSLAARKELAAELHYSGSTEDTATMNVWLIKQVLAKLAENGGKLPAELTH